MHCVWKSLVNAGVASAVTVPVSPASHITHKPARTATHCRGTLLLFTLSYQFFFLQEERNLFKGMIDASYKQSPIFKVLNSEL